MSYIYLQEQGEASSVDNFSDIPQSVLSKLRSIQDKSCCNDNETECCPSSQSGTMSAPLTESPGEEKLTLFVEDFPVKTSQQQAKERELTANAPVFGLKCTEWFARYDPNTSSWKTAQCSLFGDCIEFSETWPKYGMMLGGVCWEDDRFQTLPSYENEYGFLPAPMAADGTKAGALDRMNGKNYWNLRDWYHCVMKDLYLHGKTNALQRKREFWEWAMGWPESWTALKPLETDKFQQWQQQHFRY